MQHAAVITLLTHLLVNYPGPRNTLDPMLVEPMPTLSHHLFLECLLL